MNGVLYLRDMAHFKRKSLEKTLGVNFVHIIDGEAAPKSGFRIVIGEINVKKCVNCQSILGKRQKKYCSIKCKNISSQKRISKICLKCNKYFV